MKKVIKKEVKKEITIKTKKDMNIYDIVKLLNEMILKFFSNNHYLIEIYGKRYISIRITYPINKPENKEKITYNIDEITISNPENNIILPTIYLSPAHFENTQHIYFRINMLEDNISYKLIQIITKQIFYSLNKIDEYIKKIKRG